MSFICHMYKSNAEKYEKFWTNDHIENLFSKWINVSECIYFVCQKRIDLTCKILFDISDKYLIQINMFGEAMLMPDGVPAAAAVL